MNNPFQTIQGIIKDQPVILRPVQFDDDNYDKNYRKSNGELIRPTMAVTTCPYCGGLVEQAISKSLDLSEQIKVFCPKCDPYVAPSPPKVFPFRDPIDRLVITLFDINPTAINSGLFKIHDEPQIHETSLSDLFSPSKSQKQKTPSPNSTNVFNDMVERRSEGLGQWMRRRDQWKKLTKAVDAHVGSLNNETSGDVFDSMGLLSEHYIDNPVDPQVRPE